MCKTHACKTLKRIMRPFCFCFKTFFNRANPLGFVCFAEVHVGLISVGCCA